MFMKSFEKTAVSQKLYDKAVAKTLASRMASSGQKDKQLGAAHAMKAVSGKIQKHLFRNIAIAQREIANPSQARPISRQLRSLKHTEMRGKGADVLESFGKKHGIE